MVGVFGVGRAGPLLAAAGLAAAALAAGLAEAQTSQTANQTAQTAAGSREAMKDTITKLENELAGKFGEAERPRIRRGIDQAAEFWRKSDGDAAAFEDVVRRYVAKDSEARNALFTRMEFALESIDGHMLEIGRDLRRQSDLDLGEIYPFDETLAGYDPRRTSTTTSSRIASRSPCCSTSRSPRCSSGSTRASAGRGGSGPRRASRSGSRSASPRRSTSRSARRTPRRTATSPSTTSGCITSSTTRARGSSAQDAAALALEPARRDQGRLPEGKEGLEKQRWIARSWIRIVTQTIPAAVVDNPRLDWNPFTNTGQADQLAGLGRGGDQGRAGVERA
jgi:hypothetical protein